MTDEINFTDEEISADPILYGMRRDKLPLTRENYIIRNYGALPLDWDAESEESLPGKLQDWSKFDDDGELVN
jgi:hypothetical protein